MSEPIKGFKNEYAWLSNFAWVKVEFEGDVYPSVEHAYVAAKILDISKRPVIAKAASGGEAKKLGRLYEMRTDWSDVKIEVMNGLLIQKFAKEPFLSKLLQTGDTYIEETNWWNDTFWGVCRGIGENHLGKLIMSIRSDLQALQDHPV